MTTTRFRYDQDSSSVCVCGLWHVKRVPRNLPQHLPSPNNET